MKTATGSQPVRAWRPLEKNKLSAIEKCFTNIFPAESYDDLARRISAYWIDMLRHAWDRKKNSVKATDTAYDPADPLSRIWQKTVVIAYADSVFEPHQKTLSTLDAALKRYFPAVGGLHLLPACVVAKNRFNDGYFSQIVRDRIDPAFGTNAQFADMMEKYFSMADFVLNHVDIDHPAFKAYLNGDDAAGRCFYVFSETEYRVRRNRGDFDRIFRPRPFPLFSIFRRAPKDQTYDRMRETEKIAEINRRLHPEALPEPLIGLLSIFHKIKNDQMLLDADYRKIERFRKYLSVSAGIDPDHIFRLSTRQETQHPPWIFADPIESMSELLAICGYDALAAKHLSSLFETHAADVFGEEIHAMTTFSHVQVDLNTGTFEGLKLLADDFSWYLGNDLNLLRLDAANFAFKKWGTSCFGLPEVKRLMQILFLSMECVAPRIVANLEVNDRLGTILAQMADPNALPPMMYDFHLASLLPAVFNSCNADILDRIDALVQQYAVPKQSIRFSVTETHDGKSVRGSLDLLPLTERLLLAETVSENGGRIKYKAVPEREFPEKELTELCALAGLDKAAVRTRLFDTAGASSGILKLKDRIVDEQAIADSLGIGREVLSGSAFRYFINRVLYGRDPYELCCSTRDALLRIDDQNLEAHRFLAFHTLAFAVMGRNVKSIYFNDLFGLPNDHARVEKSGELRDIKRTRSDAAHLAACLSDPSSIHAVIAVEINQLIAIVDADPALSVRGSEAEYIASGNPSVALIHNHCGLHHTLTVVNISGKPQSIVLNLSEAGCPVVEKFLDNISGEFLQSEDAETLSTELQPYQRLWLTSHTHANRDRKAE